MLASGFLHLDFHRAAQGKGLVGAVAVNKPGGNG